MRSLPPLRALHIFETAARTGSYVAAAAELGLTHGAVSRQIAVLERWLGQRLFTRAGRRMTPTPAAQAFAAEVSLSFDRLTVAAEACGRLDTPRVVRVSAPTTFAMRWLIPRLDRFHAERPEAEVVVSTTTTHAELRGGFDLAVRRDPREDGAGPSWGSYRAVHFLDEADTLVASPALSAARPLREPGDIADHVLLSSETRPGDWTDWLDAAGLPRRTGRRRMFDHFSVTLQAVKDGLGIGVGPLPVLAIDVAAERLVLPFPEIVVRRPGYVALVPNDADKTPSLSALVDWLVAQGSEPASAAPKG